MSDSNCFKNIDLLKIFLNIIITIILKNIPVMYLVLRFYISINVYYILFI